MFDRYEIEQGPSTVNVNVEERRAPTDDSVRLLREMEEAAEKKRIASLRVQDNGFDGLIQVFADHAELTVTAKATFSLNGRRLSASATQYGYRPGDVIDGNSLLEDLRDATSREIANHLIVTGWPRSFN